MESKPSTTEHSNCLKRNAEGKARRHTNHVFRTQEQVTDMEGEAMHAQTRREGSKKMKGMLEAMARRCENPVYREQVK